MKLVNVDFIPDKLEPDTLYVSREYGTASHLCACGCGGVAVTPLGKGSWNWKLTDGQGGPTLAPSILNRWCRAHYWIRSGNVVWC